MASLLLLLLPVTADVVCMVILVFCFAKMSPLYFCVCIIIYIISGTFLAQRPFHKSCAIFCMTFDKNMFFTAKMVCFPALEEDKATTILQSKRYL